MAGKNPFQLWNVTAQDPMSEPGATLMRGLLEAFILERLTEGPRHGYALLKEMGARFGEEPNRNKLYPLLARMEKEGLLTVVPEAGGDRARTAYAITASGRAALEAYRRLPAPFLESVQRLWGIEAVAIAPPATAPPLPPAPQATPVSIPVRAGPAPIPAEASHGPAPGEVPYPCEDARVTIEKNARTGDLVVRLAGCPMGAYEYCTRCPVHASVAGLRRLTFG